MLEARIIGAAGSLYYASDVTAYDLETLRQHLRDCRRQRDSDVTLEMTIENGPSRAMLTAWLGAMADAGYHVRVRQQQHGETAA